MYEYENLKRQIDNLRKKIPSIVNNNIRANGSNFYRFQNDKDPQVRLFIQEVINYFKTIKSQIETSYENTLNDLNDFIMILENISICYGNISKINNQIRYGSKIIKDIYNFLNEDYKTMKDEVINVKNHLLELREDIYCNTDKQSHVEIYNFLNSTSIVKYGDLLSNSEIDKSKYNKIKTIIECDNVALEEINYLIMVVENYNRNLKMYKNNAYATVEYVKAKKNKLIKNKEKICYRTKSGKVIKDPFENLLTFANNLSDDSMNLIISGCFSLNLFDVTYYDSTTSSRNAFGRLNSSKRSDYNGYFKCWVRSLKYYLNGKGKEEGY